MTHTNLEDSLAGLAWGDHAACVCETADERIELLSAYLRQGLERREMVRYVTDRVIPGGLLDAVSVKIQVMSREKRTVNSFFLASPHLFEKDFPSSTLHRWLKEIHEHDQQRQ